MLRDLVGEELLGEEEIGSSSPLATNSPQELTETQDAQEAKADPSESEVLREIPIDEDIEDVENEPT